jgi:hypothetical protein
LRNGQKEQRTEAKAARAAIAPASAAAVMRSTTPWSNVTVHSWRAAREYHWGAG